MENDWTVVAADESLRQGDLLLRRDPSRGQILDICLVATADCDISKAKFGSFLSCLAVDSFESYARSTWSEVRGARARGRAVQKMHEQLRRWHSEKLGATSTLTAEGIVHWLLTASADSICSDLQVPDNERKKLVPSLQALKEGLPLIDANGPDAMERLVAFRCKLEGKPEAEIHNDLRTQLANDDLQDDVFLLPNLPQVEIAPAVIRLRNLVPVRPSLIVYRAVDAGTSDHYLRIGRLSATLKYAVSQKFGSLYSRIGLSQDFEERCDAALEAHKLGSVKQ